MNRSKTLSFVCVCIALAGCGDDGQATNGTPEDTGSTGEVEATTMGAGPTSSDDPATTNDPSTTSGGSATSDGDTTAATDGSGSSGDAPTAGVCVATCREDQDCCPFGALGCPSEDYPNNWSCDEGFCAFGGCSEDAECIDLLDPSQECHPISGIGTCFEPCREDGDCAMLLGRDGTCTGVADDGSMYCEVPVDPCRTDDDCGGSGTCDVAAGTCGCTVDDECTEDGMGCHI